MKKSRLRHFQRLLGGLFLLLPVWGLSVVEGQTADRGDDSPTKGPGSWFLADRWPGWAAEWENEGEAVALNWDLSTLGGMQFWTDLRHCGGWRIQQHCSTGHCRLLDASNVRRAWGTQEECNRLLDNQISGGVVPPNRPTVVILAHGLARTRGCWWPMSQAIRNETDWQVVDFSYASTRLPMARHAGALKSVIDSLGPEVRQIHFVGHSMGNIVIRHYLGDTTDPNSGRQGDARIGRMVMIAPPNQGSKFARVLQPTGLFPLVAGRSGVELGRDWELLEPKLATPAFEFGIIAGGDLNQTRSLNPLLAGSSDLTVSVEETQLDGARETLVKPWLHPTIMKQPEVCAATVHFLRNGSFSPNSGLNPLSPPHQSPERDPEKGQRPR